MKIEKYRHIIIFRTLIASKEAVTASSLARLTNSSLRTIKNDISFLDSLCQKEGFMHIRSYKAKGYMLEANDEKRFREFSDNIEVLSSLFYGRNIESVNRRLYILQRFLVDDHVKIEDLCDELFMSRSSIRNDLGWATRFLNSYHIELETVVGQGYRISGKEQDLRSAMVELRCSQYHEFQPLYPYGKFDDLFRRDGVNHYNELRRAFLDVLRDSRIVISDIETKKIASHICLMYNRIAEGRHPELEDKIIRELKETYDYEIAEKIFEHQTIRNYIDADETEVLNFARLLLINRDLNLRIGGVEDLPAKLVIENQKIFREVLKDTEDSLGANIHNMDLFRIYSRDLESLQLELYLKHHYDHTGKMRFITYQEGSEDLFSPIPLELTRAMIARLQIRFDSKISDAVVQTYAGVYERLLKKVVYPYKKRRLAVVTTQGLVYSQHIAERMNELFSPYIERIDTYNLYEMRKLDFSDFDAVIHSGFMLYYSYPVPAVAFEELDYNKNVGTIFDKLFIHGFDRSELEEFKKFMRIFEDERVRDIYSFIEALSYRYAHEPDDQKILYDQFIENENIINHYYSRNGIMIVFFPYKYTERRIVDIYIPDQSVYYREGLEVKALIAASVDPDISLANLKILDHILRYIVQVPDTVNRLIGDKDEELDRIFDTIIRRRFYSTI